MASKKQVLLLVLTSIAILTLLTSSYLLRVNPPHTGKKSNQFRSTNITASSSFLDDPFRPLHPNPNEYYYFSTADMLPLAIQQTVGIDTIPGNGRRLLHIGVIIPFQSALYHTSDSTAELLNQLEIAYQWCSLQAKRFEAILNFHFYIGISTTQFWKAERILLETDQSARFQELQQQYAKLKLQLHLRSCSSLIDNYQDQPNFELQYYNCLADYAYFEGVDYVAIVDELEWLNDIQPSIINPKDSWILKSIVALEHHQLNPTMFIEDIRHLGMAGRGVLFRSLLDTTVEYVQLKFQEEINSALDQMQLPMIYQYKPLVHYSASIMVHRQHFQAFHSLFHNHLSTLRQGIEWMTRVYGFIRTSLVDLPPHAYLDYENFMSTTQGTVELEQEVFALIEPSELEILTQYEVEKLLDYHQILGCDELEQRLSDEEAFAPESKAHSSKAFIKTANVEGYGKVFMYEHTQGGTYIKRRSTLRNLRAMLLLRSSPLFVDLVGYCPTTRRTVAKFVESRGDILSGLVDQTCVARIQACIDLLRTLQIVHSIGMVQCDWKLGQWIFDPNGVLIMIDVDSFEHIPTDCGQIEVHRHPAHVNFHQVNEETRSWSNNATIQFLEDQFLIDRNHEDYPLFDYRFDTYKLGGMTYFHDMMNYHGSFPCALYRNDVKRIVEMTRLPYPPTLEQLIEELEAFQSRITFTNENGEKMDKQSVVDLDKLMSLQKQKEEEQSNQQIQTNDIPQETLDKLQQMQERAAIGEAPPPG